MLQVTNNFFAFFHSLKMPALPSIILENVLRNVSNGERIKISSKEIDLFQLFFLTGLTFGQVKIINTSDDASTKIVNSETTLLRLLEDKYIIKNLYFCKVISSIYFSPLSTTMPTTSTLFNDALSNAISFEKNQTSQNQVFSIYSNMDYFPKKDLTYKF